MRNYKNSLPPTVGGPRRSFQELPVYVAHRFLPSDAIVSPICYDVPPLSPSFYGKYLDSSPSSYNDLVKPASNNLGQETPNCSKVIFTGERNYGRHLLPKSKRKRSRTRKRSFGVGGSGMEISFNQSGTNDVHSSTREETVSNPVSNGSTFSPLPPRRKSVEENSEHLSSSQVISGHIEKCLAFYESLDPSERILEPNVVRSLIVQVMYNKLSVMSQMQRLMRSETRHSARYRHVIGGIHGKKSFLMHLPCGDSEEPKNESIVVEPLSKTCDEGISGLALSDEEEEDDGCCNAYESKSMEAGGGGRRVPPPGIGWNAPHSPVCAQPWSSAHPDYDVAISDSPLDDEHSCTSECEMPCKSSGIPVYQAKNKLLVNGSSQQPLSDRTKSTSSACGKKVKNGECSVGSGGKAPVGGGGSPSPRGSKARKEPSAVNSSPLSRGGATPTTTAVKNSNSKSSSASRLVKKTSSSIENKRLDSPVSHPSRPSPTAPTSLSAGATRSGKVANAPAPIPKKRTTVPQMKPATRIIKSNSNENKTTRGSLSKLSSSDESFSSGKAEKKSMRPQSNLKNSPRNECSPLTKRNNGINGHENKPRLKKSPLNDKTNDSNIRPGKQRSLNHSPGVVKRNGTLKQQNQPLRTPTPKKAATTTSTSDKKPVEGSSKRSVASESSSSNLNGTKKALQVKPYARSSARSKGEESSCLETKVNRMKKPPELMKEEDLSSTPITSSEDESSSSTTRILYSNNQITEEANLVDNLVNDISKEIVQQNAKFIENVDASKLSKIVDASLINNLVLDNKILNNQFNGIVTTLRKVAESVDLNFQTVENFARKNTNVVQQASLSVENFDLFPSDSRDVTRKRISNGSSSWKITTNDLNKINNLKRRMTDLTKSQELLNHLEKEYKQLKGDEESAAPLINFEELAQKFEEILMPPLIRPVPSAAVSPSADLLTDEEALHQRSLSLPKSFLSHRKSKPTTNPSR